MSDLMLDLFRILIFPGFVFSILVGLFLSWVVRKVSALVQWRVGPPVRQPLYDVLKLLGKETLIPEQAQQGVFIGAPVIGFASVLLLSTILWMTAINQSSFIGDIIVIIYLMVLPSLALILGSGASGSPHAALGTGREMKMVMGYELPLVLAFIVIVIKSGGQLNLATIAGNAHALSISGMIAFLISLLCIQAKLGFVPFDIAESETEIAGGVLIEYSGALLAVWKLMQALMLAALPMFMVMVFMGGFGTSGWPLVWGIGKYLLVVVLVILIKNTNPRVRIDQAMKFFWVYCGILMAIAVVLASIGNNLGINWL